jgi:uncharacterized protein (DUF608 family)
MGGLRLAGLRMLERMAQKMGDDAFVRQCQEWLLSGQQSLEGEMWNGRYYLNFWEKETGKKSDDVMAYQFDGQWAARYHGLPGIFKDDRVKIGLETIRQCNIALAPDIGAVNFARPDGSALATDDKVAEYGSFSTFTPELLTLAMNFIYAGEKTYGMQLAQKYWKNLILKQRYAWDLPLFVHGITGKRTWGTDYYQNMMLWALPVAISDGDIASFSSARGLIDRIIQASRKVD